MKKLILFLIIVMVFITNAKTQIISSRCMASDSIINIYKEDAARLALRYWDPSGSSSSIRIPENYKNQILNALIAVHNSTVIPEADTVINKIRIHTKRDKEMSEFKVAALSDLPWMQQLRLGNLPCGNATIDSLLLTYNFTIEEYYAWDAFLPNHLVSFKTDSFYNLPPLMRLISNIPGVEFCEPNITYGDGNDIKYVGYNPYSYTTYLEYSLGGGDCPAGCTERRYWKFGISNNCNVQFIQSYGSVFPTANAGPDKTICQGQSVTLSASGNNNFYWRILGSYNTLSYSSIVTVSPTVTTTYLLTAYNGIGTSRDEVVVLVNPAVNPQIYGSLNYNSGGYATLSTDNYPVINWSTGAHNTQSVNVTTINNPISVSVIDNQGCMGTSNSVNVVQNAPLNTIQGTVSYSGGNLAAGDGVVNLFQFGLNGYHQLVDAIDIGTNGSFVFNNIPNGDYYLYVKINNDGYPYQNVKNSYFDSTYRWQDARLIHIDNGNTNVALHLYETNIQLVGNGIISGIVNYINHSQNKFNKNYVPVEGANIYIMSELSQEITASDVTLSDGSYKICSIPDGNYKMYVDFSGFPLIETYTNIQVNNNCTIFPEMNFYVDTTYATAGIYTDEATKTKTFESEQFAINVYPNPMSDILNIDFNIKERSNISIGLIDMQGKEKLLVSSKLYEAGMYKWNYHTKTEIINKGMYLVKFVVNNNIYLKKIIVQ